MNIIKSKILTTLENFKKELAEAIEIPFNELEKYLSDIDTIASSIRSAGYFEDMTEKNKFMASVSYKFINVAIEMDTYIDAINSNTYGLIETSHILWMYQGKKLNNSTSASCFIAMIENLITKIPEQSIESYGIDTLVEFE